MMRILVTATLFVASALLGATTASAQVPGDLIVFAVPVGSEVALPSGDDPGDKVLFTGGPSEQLASGGTCATGITAWAQNTVFVDTRQPQRRLSRRIEIIVFRSEPVAPGTRLTNFVPAGSNCVISGVEYARFVGTVD